MLIHLVWTFGPEHRGIEPSTREPAVKFHGVIAPSASFALPCGDHRMFGGSRERVTSSSVRWRSLRMCDRAKPRVSIHERQHSS
jgi:hypothetical protein